MTATILTMVSILPALGASPLPDFSNPVKGFEPRGTTLSDQIVTLGNYEYALQLDRTLFTQIFNISHQSQQRVNSSPEDNSSSVQRRRRRSAQLPPCSPFSPIFRIDDNVIFVFEASDSSQSMFEASKLKAACSIENDILSSSSYSSQHCSRILDTEPGKTRCCPNPSLGNYIALLNNRTTCQDITDQDVSNVKSLLLQCHRYFVKQTLEKDCAIYSCKGVPAVCTKYNAVYNIFQFITDDEMSPSNGMFLRYTASFPEMYQNEYDYLYKEQLKDGVPEKEGVKLASFKFSNYKFDQFSEKLLAEVIYPALAMIFVFLIMWFFLGSFILTFTGLFCIIYAIGLSYFLYTMVFKIDFFPFLNVTTLVFLVGIGADDAFVYYDIWRQTRAANPYANIMQLTLKTLRYAALSMLVTSLTTASAFFAGVSSSITAIRLFGLFAGTSILTNYLLMITYFPAVVALHEKWVLKYTDGHSSLEVVPTESNDCGKIDWTEIAPVAQDMSENTTTKLEENSRVKEEERHFCFLQVIDFPCSSLISATNFFKTASLKVFEDYLPRAVIKLRYIWIALLVCLTAGFLCVNFVEPRLRPPDSKDFQMFASSHPLERYFLKYKSYFRFEQKTRGMSVEMLWGIKPEDNGNHLNPDDKGTLQMDENFDESSLFSPSGQSFLRSLCQSIRNQSFFLAFGSGRQCPIETFIEICTSPDTACCGVNASFPFSADTVERCVRKASTSNDTGFLFDGQEKIVGFHLQILTDQSFTTSFTAMDDFWKKVTSWFDKEMAEAPTGLENGWVGCWNLDFYALQIGLSEGTYSSLGISVAVSFGVMLFTTLNIFISIYAIITIIGIISITIGCLVLAGWQLNILESIVVSVAVGLSIDFTMHYGVAYRLAPDKSQRDSRVRYSLVHIGSAITMAAVTTFLTGLMMMPATVLAYFQLGQFLMLVMVFSWLYSTFGFLSICSVIGPKNNFGQLSITRVFWKCGLCRSEPVRRIEVHASKTMTNEVINLNEHVHDERLLEKHDDVTSPLPENPDCV
ncbi:protein dispatched homolog 1-like isoform X2 [Stylophora pistillata]|nr:protein dispatched homolog 1-like isoform X2 [Stylophora pistillata]